MQDLNVTSAAWNTKSVNDDRIRLAALLLVVGAGVIVLIAILPLVAGLLAGPALAVLFRPLHSRMATRLGDRLSALVVLLMVWVLIVLPGGWLVTLAVQQIPGALREIHDAVSSLSTHRVAGIATWGEFADRATASLLAWAGGNVGPAFARLGRGIVDLSIALLGLYFLLVSRDEGWHALRRRLPVSPAGSDALRATLAGVTRATLLGTLSSAALQGLSIGLGLYFIGNPSPAFWGLVGGFATLVPVVGNALVWIPATVVPLLHHRIGAVVIMLIAGKAVPSLIDRIVRAVVSRRVGNVHPMVTLVGALAGLTLVGVVGVLIGPTIIQCCLSLAALYEREYGLPWMRPTPEINVKPLL